MKWFRLYSEIKDDPKMLALTDHQFRIWINLLAMASDTSERGIIPRFPMRGLAAALHTTEDQLIEALDLFASEDFNLIARQEDGSIFITKFADRQYDNPSDQPKKVNERVKKHREQKRNENKTSDSITITTCNDNVTPSNALDTDTDIDTEIIKDDDDNSAGASEVLSVYQNEIGIVSPTVAEFLTDAVERYSPDWVKAAILEAVKHNARSWSYIDACLKNWKVHGFGVKPGKQATAATAQSNGPPTPEQAWCEVSSNLDPTKRHKWSNSKISEAVQKVGLRVLFGQHDLAYKKSEFIKAYQGGG